MNRVKLFEVNWDSRFDTLVNNIIKHKFDDNNTYGFQIYKKRNDFLNASFIKKKEIEEEILNPITNESTIYKRVVYEQTMFTLNNSNIGIEIFNPNRSIKEIINIFSSMSNFSISIKEVNLDLSMLLNSFRNKFDNFEINQITYIDIRINNTVIKIDSRNERDSLELDMNEFLGNNKYKIEKIKCNFKVNENYGSFELSNRGSLKTDKKNLDFLNQLIKDEIKG
jgi:hypothetical protein